MEKVNLPEMFAMRRIHSIWFSDVSKHSSWSFSSKKNHDFYFGVKVSRQCMDDDDEKVSILNLL